MSPWPDYMLMPLDPPWNRHGQTWRIRRSRYLRAARNSYHGVPHCQRRSLGAGHCALAASLQQRKFIIFSIQFLYKTSQSQHLGPVFLDRLYQRRNLKEREGSDKLIIKKCNLIGTKILSSPHFLYHIPYSKVPLNQTWLYIDSKLSDLIDVKPKLIQGCFAVWVDKK